jgi:osmotically-inducible protein OsmY
MKTDTQLLHDVQAELDWDPGLDDAQIGISVRHGVVTLSGSVRTPAHKVAAERAAIRVFGVEEVDDDLVVRQPDGPERPGRAGVQDHCIAMP